MVRLTKQNVQVFQSVIEKVGLTKMLTTMALPITRTQQAVITAFATLITSEARLSRLLENKVTSVLVALIFWSLWTRNALLGTFILRVWVWPVLPYYIWVKPLLNYIYLVRSDIVVCVFFSRISCWTWSSCWRVRHLSCAARPSLYYSRSLRTIPTCCSSAANHGQ